ncbi:MAG: hypothetical protein ACI8ZB_003853 [Desulforhopalus sp.]|jgi:hypothetical protein
MITAMSGKERFFSVSEMFCRFLIIIVLLAAALPKLFNIADFGEIINAYGMLPDMAVQPVAVILPLVEIGLAVALLFKIRLSKYLTIFLLLFFIAILSYAVVQGLDIDCGCFGPEDPEHRAFQGLRIAIVRDVGMIFLLLYSIWYDQYQKSNTNISRS